VRGTGCALAAAIASRLARGAAIAEACRGAGDWLAAMLRALGPAAADGLPRQLPFGRVLPLVGDPAGPG
jgi:hydroxymethylpyrimidine/phosphomethylpyrimidine kinase